MKTASARKAALSPEEKLKVTYFHMVEGIDQHILAAMFNVNAGRIAEAVKAVREAAGYPKKEAPSDQASLKIF